MTLYFRLSRFPCPGVLTHLISSTLSVFSLLSTPLLHRFQWPLSWAGNLSSLPVFLPLLGIWILTLVSLTWEHLLGRTRVLSDSVSVPQLSPPLGGVGFHLLIGRPPRCRWYSTHGKAGWAGPGWLVSCPCGGLIISVPSPSSEQFWWRL